MECTRSDLVLVLVALLAAAAACLVGCGSIEPLPLVAADAGADQAAAALDAAAPDGPTAENPPSDAAAAEVPPACPDVVSVMLVNECRPGCLRCLDQSYALLARAGAPCVPPGAVALCVYACGDCP
jgi:hypothetical protein